VIRNDKVLMNYPALHSDIIRHFWLALFCMTGVIYSQETKALSKEGIHCPRSINRPFLSTLWHPFCGMCLSPCYMGDVCVMNSVEINSVFLLMNICSMIYLSTQTWA